MQSFANITEWRAFRRALDMSLDLFWEVLYKNALWIEASKVSSTVRTMCVMDLIVQQANSFHFYSTNEYLFDRIMSVRFIAVHSSCVCSLTSNQRSCWQHVFSGVWRDVRRIFVFSSWTGCWMKCSTCVCLVGDFFTDSTMVNHHCSPPFVEYFYCFQPPKKHL